MNESDDLALQALLSVRAEVAPELSEKLLRDCYAIQLKHQFNDDRNQSSTAMDRLVDLEIDAQSKEQAS